MDMTICELCNKDGARGIWNDAKDVFLCEGCKSSTYILKIYLNPKGVRKGFIILKDCSWESECEYERNAPLSEDPCSSMSQHDSYSEALDQARRELPEKLFQICF